jgi:hypothetical protein
VDSCGQGKDPSDSETSWNFLTREDSFLERLCFMESVRRLVRCLVV